jgi:pSer/pThr/pTyr-binding forkhead associated (FHA) protein
VFVNSATGLSLEAETTGRAQLEEIAGRVATTVTVADGMPWRAFDDFDMGDTVAYTDRTNREVIGVVTAIEIHRDRATGRAATVTIGRPPDVAVGSRAKRSGAAALTIANQLSLS